MDLSSVFNNFTGRWSWFPFCFLETFLFSSRCRNSLSGEKVLCAAKNDEKQIPYGRRRSITHILLLVRLFSTLVNSFTTLNIQIFYRIYHRCDRNGDSNSCTYADVDFELACVMYDIGVIHASIAASESRIEPDVIFFFS